MLHINDLTYRIEGRVLFDQATLAISEGQKVGLVGRNGTGKSTLFNLIKASVDGGDDSITIRKGARLGAVGQEVPSGPESLIDTVLAADKERAALLREAETATEPHRIAFIHTRLGDIDAYSAEARAAIILTGLGFEPHEQLKPCSDFSGGWRMRVALAAMLFAEPDILLLDEPTNYLDVEGAVWLESHIKTYPGTCFIISHDRDFLNAGVTHIAHLREGKLFGYSGGYDTFERTLAEQIRLNMALRSKQDDERRHLESFVNRFRAQANKAKQAQSRVKRLEKMKPVSTIITDPIAPIDLPSPERSLSPPIVRFDKAQLGYSLEKPILRFLEQRIAPDDRIGLLGKNGEGKSTFAKGIMGILDAQEGFIKRHKKMEIGYFAQHQIDSLNPQESAYDHIRELMPDATEAQRRARLASFGLGQKNSETAAGDLSGGEKARLLFSLIGFKRPHLLVLDEPANHLDMDSRAELIKSLNAYTGAVLIISHDRNLLESVVDRLWVVSGGTVKSYDGSLEDYRQEQLDRARASKKPKDKALPKAQQARKDAADARKRIAPLKKKSETFEPKIEKLKAKIADIDEQLAVTDLFTKNTEKAVTLSQERVNHIKLIETLEMGWLDALEAYEAARKAEGLD